MADRPSAQFVRKRLIYAPYGFKESPNSGYDVRNDTLLYSHDAHKEESHADDKGNLWLMLGDNKYLACDLIWLMMTGEWPAKEIVHKDGLNGNNTWDNLALKVD